MIDERDDYADHDLPPSRSWVPRVLYTLLCLCFIGCIIVAVFIYFLVSLQRFD